jgi:hypothetical protein
MGNIKINFFTELNETNSLAKNSGLFIPYFDHLNTAADSGHKLQPGREHKEKDQQYSIRTQV